MNKITSTLGLRFTQSLIKNSPFHNKNQLASSYSTTMKGRKFILQNQFAGVPKESDVKIVEEELLPLTEGQFLCETVFISVDPYQRAYYQKPGNVVLGSQVARVIQSRSPKYPEGTHLVSYYGWKTHHVLDDTNQDSLSTTYLIPENTEVPLSYYLSVFGMPGVTAHFGFLEICQPKAGETVVVTGAAGAVGSLVGQIAKIKQCKVIGVVGTEEKGKWITGDLGFDGYINYKKDDIIKELKNQAPEGIDCYFDNVGGEISSQIISKMNKFGRISVCGAISGYNDPKAAKASAIQGSMVFNQLKMEGFLAPRYLNRWDEAVNSNVQLWKEGKLKNRETVTKGFENTFQAFSEMLKGLNFGKAIVEI